MQNVPRDTGLNYFGEDLKGPGPQQETLLMCITFIARNFFKGCFLYKVQLLSGCVFVIKPSQFRKFKPCHKSTFHASNWNPLRFIFKRRGPELMYHFSTKRSIFQAVISLQSALNCVLSIRRHFCFTPSIPRGGLYVETIHLCKLYFFIFLSAVPFLICPLNLCLFISLRLPSISDHSLRLTKLG